ncbi:unnamed protein product, partial [Closterium sp. Naga37s-1]
FVQFFVRSVPDAQVKTYKYILNSLLTLLETNSVSMHIPGDDLRLLLGLNAPLLLLLLLMLQCLMTPRCLS